VGSRWCTPDHHLETSHIEAFSPQRHRGLYHGIRVLNCDLNDFLLGFFLARGLHTLSSNFLSLGQYCARSSAKYLGRGKCQLKASVFSEEVTSTSHIAIQLLHDWESGWLPVNNFLALVWKKYTIRSHVSENWHVFRTPPVTDDKVSGVRQNLQSTMKPRREERHAACFLYTYNLPTDCFVVRPWWRVFMFRCRNRLSAFARYFAKSAIALRCFTWNMMVAYFLNFLLCLFVCLVVL
jgi:hypothetical protein